MSDGARCVPAGPAREGALNKDEGKVRWNLLPFETLVPIIRVLDFGCVKYEAHNWKKGMDLSRNFNSLMRHLVAWWEGQDKDDETGLSHLGHAGCRILFLIYHELHKELHTYDDRYRPAQVADEAECSDLSD